MSLVTFTLLPRTRSDINFGAKPPPSSPAAQQLTTLASTEHGEKTAVGASTSSLA